MLGHDMMRIKQAAEVTGVPEHTLRAWERRYGAFGVARSSGGYRLYDEQALDQIRLMRELVTDGLPPREASAEVARRQGSPGQVVPPPADPREWERLPSALQRLDAVEVKAIVDEQFARLDFETLVDSWLMPVLRQVGNAWSREEITVAGEHLMSNVILRRLAPVFDAAGTPTSRPPVIIGAPTGVLHDLALMTFAVCVRRQGVPTLFLGHGVPVPAWVDAQWSTGSDLSITGIYRRADAPRVAALAEGLWRAQPRTQLLVGGSQQRLAPAGSVQMGHSLAAGARTVAELVGVG